MTAHLREPDAPKRRLWPTGAAVLVVLVAVLICLIPKTENDLFFILRTGDDILTSHSLPHADPYSWVNRGVRWDLPEWLAYVAYAFCFRAGGFFGTLILKTVLVTACALVVWRTLERRTGVTLALLLTSLMLLALGDTVQQRPYAFTYALLPVALRLLLSSRAAFDPEDTSRVGVGRRRIWLLVPLSALWANLHQGVMVPIGLLFVYAAGDLIVYLRYRYRESRSGFPDLLLAGPSPSTAFPSPERHRFRSAWIMLVVGAACASAAAISPYGWGIYRNVFVTLSDPSLMNNVTEWRSASILPPVQLLPFIAIATIVGGALAASRKPRLADTLAVLALLVEALLHVRNIAIFVIGSLLVGAEHLESCLARLRQFVGAPSDRQAVSPLVVLLSLTGVACLGLVSIVSLRQSLGAAGINPRGAGEASVRLSSYPKFACAFMEANKFPARMRILNDFETGGYLLWRMPSEPVFIDGRLDVYAGRTFDDMLVLSRPNDLERWNALVDRYDFDCVLTENMRVEQALQLRPDWQMVYARPEPRHHRLYYVFLRRRPEYAELIARCLGGRCAFHAVSRLRAVVMAASLYCWIGWFKCIRRSTIIGGPLL